MSPAQHAHICHCSQVKQFDLTPSSLGQCTSLDSFQPQFQPTMEIGYQGHGDDDNDA